jgi:cobalt-zinc-cadmium efflux system outer membrane protein
MSAFRAAPAGVAWLLFTATLNAAPRPDRAPTPSSANGTPTSLQAAVRRLWDTSPDVQASKAQLDAARARADAAARPLYNPALALDAEDADVNRRTAGLSLTLDLSGKRRARASQGSAELRVSEAHDTLVRRDIAARWLKAWSATALAERQNVLGQQRLALMQRFDELAAQRLKVGDISSTERDLAGLALGEAQVQQVALVANEAAARANLQAVGAGLVANLPVLPDDLPPPLVEAPAARASDELPELVQARAEQDSAEASVRVAQRARVPDPTVSLTGGQVRNGAISDRVVGLSVSIPLPVLNTGRAEVAAAQAQAEAVAADARARRQVLDAALVEARTRYEAMRSASMAFRAGRAAAFEDRAVLLEKLWRAGEIGTSDYLVQLKQSLDTALSGLELESRAWQAWFDYLAAAGRLTDWIDGRSQEISR